jgi:8-oxo-dGTP pyrophosphatase MutT (NUDIX family)
MSGDALTWMPHVTVATVVEQQGRFLVVEEEADGALVYNQPAGHWDDHETLPAAAVRETLEETGWTVALDALLGLYHWRHPVSGITFLRVCFVAHGLRHAPDRPLDQGIRRALWLRRDELAARPERLRSPLVLRCIDDYRAGRRYPLELLVQL